MAKRSTPTTRNETTAAERKRNGNGRTADNGENRPTLSVRMNDKGQIFSHIRQDWVAGTPEERVRQAYVVTLHNEYGFDLDQMEEEKHVAGRGSARARADVVI
jgi:Type I restriction enzyme R protein N terminus (HSDR_N)